MNLWFMFIGAMLPTIVYSQSADTTYLQEVKVYGIPFTSFATGSTIETIASDSTIETLGDRLFDNTTLYLKTYGHGQLTTIAMRGSTASQTAVLWNGININSPTLGQTDFSLLPLFLVDEVSVRYGSSSALYGSDAIGGSILLGQAAPRFTKYTQVSALQQLGSFGRMSTGLKLNAGSDRWEFRTKFTHMQLNNNFRYYSPANGFEKVQEHAGVTNYGVDQQIFYKISSRQQLSLEGMLTHNFREVQPAVTNNDGDETMHDDHLRLCLNYIVDSNIGVISATTAYINNNQTYDDGGKVSTVQSTQLTAQFHIDQMINMRSSFRYGGNFNHFTAVSQHYAAGLNENRFDVFTSYRLAVLPQMLVSLDLRQAFYNRSNAPFTPSVGFDWTIKDGAIHKVTWRALAGSGFRIPTLNDRYWQPGGNPDIQAEQSLNIESGARWSVIHDRVNISVDVTAFKNWMTDMIVWLESAHAGVWAPSNLQQVHVHGSEIRGAWQQQVYKTKLRFNIAYSYVKSINQKGLNEHDDATVNKQLAYVPVHSGRAMFGAEWNGWTGNAQLSFTGKRFVALDNTTALDPYALVSFELNKKIHWEKWRMLLKVECDNLFDIYYENLLHRAMPGRNYTVSVFINFKK